MADPVKARKYAIMTEITPEALAVIGGRHFDPFAYLGLHWEEGVELVRVYIPGYQRCALAR